MLLYLYFIIFLNVYFDKNNLFIFILNIILNIKKCKKNYLINMFKGYKTKIMALNKN